MGDKYLRKLLVVGMTALVRRARQNPERDPRLADLLARKPTKVATVAMANKTGRIIWAIMTWRDKSCRSPTGAGGINTVMRLS
jgi:transposase